MAILVNPSVGKKHPVTIRLYQHQIEELDMASDETTFSKNEIIEEGLRLFYEKHNIKNKIKRKVG